MQTWVLSLGLGSHWHYNHTGQGVRLRKGGCGKSEFIWGKRNRSSSRMKGEECFHLSGTEEVTCSSIKEKS